MRCLYRERAYYCGDYVEVDIFPVFAPAGVRKKKAKPTSETQEKLNRKNAERKLVRLLNTNFSGEDLEVHLTYADEFLPTNEEQAKKDVRNFLRRVKRMRDKEGLGGEFKYIIVTEGDGERTRFHHHVTMSGGISRDDVETAWGMGYANSKRLQFARNGVEGLARYVTKQFRGDKIKNGKRSWCGSKNLKKPEVKETTGKLSQKQVTEIADNGDVTVLAEQIKGFIVTEIKPFDNPYNRERYITVTMRRETEQLKRRWS